MRESLPLKRHLAQPRNSGFCRTILLDAAAKYDGVSLNDKLNTGPDPLNSLVGVLENSVLV